MNLIYGIKDKPKFAQMLLFAFQQVLAILDAMNMSVVLGTLAGDDTVMVVMRDTNSAAVFCGEIKSLMA